MVSVDYGQCWLWSVLDVVVLEVVSVGYGQC